MKSEKLLFKKIAWKSLILLTWLVWLLDPISESALETEIAKLVLDVAETPPIWGEDFPEISEFSTPGFVAPEEEEKDLPRMPLFSNSFNSNPHIATKSLAEGQPM